MHGGDDVKGVWSEPARDPLFALSHPIYAVLRQQVVQPLGVGVEGKCSGSSRIASHYIINL